MLVLIERVRVIQSVPKHLDKLVYSGMDTYRLALGHPMIVLTAEII